MENEETNPEVQLETQNEQTVEVEETLPEETQTESQSETVEETPEAKLAKAQAEAAKYRRLFEKTQKQPVAKPVAPQSVSPQSSVEETVLLANGMSEELLGELKAVAKARGISSLIKAQTDSIFVAVKEKFEKDQKQKNASLPASRGSGAVKAQKTFTTPGLSRDEHKKLVQESLG